MMKYTVLSEFADLQDGNYIYRVGDEYPRKGYSPTDERVTELSTGKNLLHRPLIQLVHDPVVVQEPESVVQVVVQESETAVEEPEITEQPKRKRGKKAYD